MVEIGPRTAVFSDTHHAYTNALLSGVPIIDPTQRRPRDLNFKPVSSAIHDSQHNLSLALTQS
ncbi:MAG: hypothetical protein AAFQ38_13195 [Pseudomonadota bacterium]